MLCAMFLNAAIDQQCEKYIQEHGLKKKVEEAFNKKFRESGLSRPEYHGQLPEDHNGLGLMLLGITGQEVLPPKIYEKILHILYRLFPAHDGRCTAVFR